MLQCIIFLLVHNLLHNVRFLSGSLFFCGHGVNFHPRLQIWCFCFSLYQLCSNVKVIIFIEAWKVQKVFRCKWGSSGVSLCINYLGFLQTSVLVPWHAWRSPVWMPSRPILPMTDQKASQCERSSLWQKIGCFSLQFQLFLPCHAF